MQLIQDTIIYWYITLCSIIDSSMISIIILSIFINVIMLPLYHYTNILEKKDNKIKQRLKPFLTKINLIKEHKTKHKQTKALYERFGYYPFYSLRSMTGLFIQIPIFIIVYKVFTKYYFGDVLDFPDALLFGINLFPILMTVININSVLLSSKSNSQERKQGIFIAMIFLILLYNQKMALVLYWTVSQAISLMRYYILYRKYQTTIAKPKLSIINRKLSIKNLILPLLTMLFPAILYYKSNVIYFTDNDLIIYFSVLLGIAILLGLVFNNIISVSLILSFMFLPIFRDYAHFNGNQFLGYIFLFAIFLYFVNLFKNKQSILAIFFLCASIYILFQNETSKQLYEAEIPQELSDLQLKDSSSIYLFMQDGFPHKTSAEYLKLENYNELMDIFKENGFNIYNVYSMANFTRATMSMAFNMNNYVKATINHKYPDGLWDSNLHHDFYINILSGWNVTNMLLQNKGYKTGIARQLDKYLFFEDNKYDINISPDSRKQKNYILKTIFKSYLNSMIDAHLNDYFIDIDYFLQFMKEKSNRDNFFAWIITGPGHGTYANLGKEKELERWINLYNTAVEKIKEQIKVSIETNPNAIIIFMSDHGPYILDDSGEPNAYKADSAFNEFNAIDNFGAFMAIRFPDKERAAKYDKDFNVTQDLFPIIFAYLFDSETPLKYKVQNTEIKIGTHKFDKGIFYKDFYK